jgi:hypothetical protein
VGREGLARQGHARGQGVHASSAPPLDLGSLCPMRARALAGDRELTVKLQVSRPTRDRAPGPSQCGSACSNPVGATNHHQHNQLGGQSCRDDSVGVHAKDDHARDLARDLPETALHVTSRRLTTPPSTAPLTSVVVWAREVLRGVVNSPSINGKDGVAASVSGRLKRANCGWWPCGRGLEWLFVRPSSLWRLSVAPRHYELVCTRSSYDAFLDLPIHL